MRNITWWKLVIIQLIGIIITILIPLLGIDRLIILAFGNHSGVDNIVPIVFIFLPPFIGWIKKIKRWYIPILVIVIPFCFALIKLIPLYIDKCITLS